MKTILVTGSSGLIGSEVCQHFSNSGYKVHGIDNNQRAIFFGAAADTRRNQRRLQNTLPHFTHHEVDVRDRTKIVDIISTTKPSVIVHAAAQPSHDLAATIPFDDFEINAVGTLNLLEAARRGSPEAPFIYLSTNKVYGDRPNQLQLIEEQNRWEFTEEKYRWGIAETFPIDQTMHSLFGTSKLAADLLVQEYGRYFGMPTCCLRGGCLTGPNHAGVALHGFLSYLIKCNVRDLEYNILGYKGKQVRDNIHCFDVATFMEAFANSPRSGEIYNIGGGRSNSCSLLEAFELTEQCTGKRSKYCYREDARLGDHICYYTDLRKAFSHFPSWKITRNLENTIKEIATAWMSSPQS